MVPARPFLRGKPGCVRSRAAWREIEPREVVEAHAQFRLVGAERVFADGEGTLEERLGLRVPALREIEPREVVEARAHIRVVGAERLFVDGEGGSELDRKMPPRVRKTLPRNDQWKAPTPNLEGHRKRLGEALQQSRMDIRFAPIGDQVATLANELVALRPRSDPRTFRAGHQCFA